MSPPQFSGLRPLAWTLRRQEALWSVTLFLWGNTGQQSLLVSIGTAGLSTGEWPRAQEQPRPVELSKGSEAPSPGRSARPRKTTALGKRGERKEREEGSQSTSCSDSVLG